MSEHQDNQSQEKHTSAPQQSHEVTATSGDSLFRDYGDFAFGILQDTWSDVEYRHEIHVDVSVAEMDSFERSGCFSFYKIPVEIRKKVLKEVCAPVMGHDARSRQSGDSSCLSLAIIGQNITQPLTPDRDWRLSEYVLWLGMHLCGLLTASNASWIGTGHETQDLEKRKEHIQKSDEVETWIETNGVMPFISDYQLQTRRSMVHPFRPQTFKEDIEVFPTTPLLTLNDLQRHLSYVDWLRKALNVSKKFRSELQDILWHKVAISSGYPDNTKCPAHGFLESRPELHKHIKTLTLSLPLSALVTGTPSPFPDFFNYPRTASVASFKFFAKTLQLENLTLCLCGRIDQRISQTVREVSEQSETSGVMESIRQIPVSSCFKVSLTCEVGLEELDVEELQVEPPEFVRGELRMNEQEQREWLRAWQLARRNAYVKKMTGILEEILRPHTLRNSPPTTHMDEYLSTRLQPLRLSEIDGNSQDNHPQRLTG